MVISQRLKKIFHAGISEMAGDVDFCPEITEATNAKFGHYQCNDAMKLASVFRKSPRQIADEIVRSVSSTPEANKIFSKLEVAGPGFINIWLTDEFLLNEMQSLFPEPVLPQLGKGKRAIVDFSSPNTAKEMHVGHLRSTIIGDAIASLMERLGYQTLRLNHIGDWGTAFGMLIAYLRAEKIDFEKASLRDLVQWYKKSKERFDQDSEFKKQSQLAVVSLQSGDEEALKSWKTICEISRRAYQEIYTLLNVRLKERGESFYNPMLQEVVKEFTEKDLVTVSDGAKCVYLDGFTNREGEPLPFMIQKSDGGFNYATTDLAAVKHRVQQERADRIIYVTDAGQVTHFQMLFQAAEKAGYTKKESPQLDHVPFGLVLGEDGKKFKTRSGEVERLIDLLNQAIERAENILDERKELQDLEKEARRELAKSIGINAVKYADLSCNRTHDYKFSYDRMLRFEGNTAPFLMYAYVRISGIKRKANHGQIAPCFEDITITHETERNLILHLCRYFEVIQHVHNDLMPNRLCEYLYELSERFNHFFRDCRVNGSEQEKSRLTICEIVGSVLKQGMEILGLRVVERM